MKIVVSSLVVLFFLSFGIVFAVLNNKEREEEEGVLGTSNEESILEGAKSTYGVPYIVSTPSLEIEEGQIYEYYPRIEDADTDASALQMELVEGPDWLVVSGMQVIGNVPYESEGTFQYTIRVSDGENTTSQKNYILVIKASE